MARSRMCLTELAAAGLVTRRRAARRDWYATRRAARYIRDARRYRAGARADRLPTPRVAGKTREAPVLASTRPRGDRARKGNALTRAS
jgi:hypothetical protein